MNRKFKKRIGVAFTAICVLALCIVYLNTSVQTKAQLNDTGGGSSSETCLNKKNKDYYNIGIKNNDASRTITLSIEHGSFDVYVYATDDATENALGTFQFKLDESNKSKTISYGIYNTDVKMKVIFVLNARVEGYCDGVQEATYTDSNGNEVTIKVSDVINAYISENQVMAIPRGSYVYIEELQLAGVQENATMENTSYNGLCKAFREGNLEAFKDYDLATDYFKKFNPSIVGGSEYQNNYLKYCYQTQVEYAYKDDMLVRMINNALRSYAADHVQTSSTPPLEKPATVLQYTPTASGIETEKLTCDAFSTKEEIAASGEGYYVNKQQFYATATEKTTGNYISCDRTCEELVTVEYGPPVATKAGLCFEYKVKVTSKYNCTSNPITINSPKPREFCTPRPYCHEAIGLTDQAGPTQEFDGCVQQCDGGDYSEACVNQCYEKVYETNTETTSVLNLNYANPVTVKELSQAFNYYRWDLNGTIAADIVLNGDGEYYVEDGIIKWRNKYGECGPKDAACNWAGLGRYYFLKVPQKTINDFKINNKNDSAGNPVWHYTIDPSGFKRAYYNGGYYCNSVCSWGGCSTDDYLNPNDAQETYQDALDSYNEELLACKAQASCTTKTSTYTISVDNKLTDGTSNKWNYQADLVEKDNTTQNNQLNGEALNGMTIVLDSGGTCYGENEYKDFDYMTEWSFPGTWINNKTGEISYQKPSNSNAWHNKEGKFCTSLKSANVNTDWWIWKIDPAKSKPKEEISIEDYNILAKATNFGYFNWNISIQCFYAIYDDYNRECTDPECPNGLSYKIRSVDNKNLFPSTNGSITSTHEYGRDPGFNWSVGATNFNNESYEITPYALMYHIQSSETYTEDNIDYEFILTKETLRELRNYNKSRGNYTKFDGNVINETGVEAYQSNLISSGFLINPNAKGRNAKIGCNNSEDPLTCETFITDYERSLKGGE